jgi:MFS family permease
MAWCRHRPERCKAARKSSPADSCCESIAKPLHPLRARWKGTQRRHPIAITAAPVATESFSAPGTSWSLSALFTVGFLGVTAGVQMSDRGLQSILLSAIQDTFEVGDATIGALQGLAGVLVASAIAVPIARLADRMSRKRVLLGLVAGWTALMVLSALAPNFPLFFIGRAASGVTEFAMIPIVYSMIPDLAPERHRVAATMAQGHPAAVGGGSAGARGRAPDQRPAPRHSARR